MTLRAIIWAAVSTPSQATDDKVSISQQVVEAEAIAKKNGWIVIDTLVMPGHSRRFYSLADLCRFARKKGFDAPDWLMSHIERNDFDVLIARNTDRLARTQSMGFEILERIIEDNKAQVYLLETGLMTRENWRGLATITTYKAASDVDNLNRRRNQTLESYAARGIPVASKIMFPFREVRSLIDNKYQRVGMEIDPQHRQLLDDVAKAILEGIGWRNIEMHLYEKYGHAHPETGGPFPSTTFYKRVHDPKWWGHSARHYKSHGQLHGHAVDTWVYDENAPLPEGVTMYRNTHEPVWDEQTRDDVKQELARRRLAVRGAAIAANPRTFAGLFVCGKCGYIMKCIEGNKPRKAIVCESRFTAIGTVSPCRGQPSINYNRVIPFVSGLLQMMLDERHPDVMHRLFPDTRPIRDSHASRLQQLQAELSDVESRLQKLVAKLSTLSADVSDILDIEINRLADRRRALLNTIDQTRSYVETEPDMLAYKQLEQQGIQEFWLQSRREINQALHRLLGQKVFVAMDGEIVGVTDAPSNRRKK